MLSSFFSDPNSLTSGFTFFRYSSFSMSWESTFSLSSWNSFLSKKLICYSDFASCNLSLNSTLNLSIMLMGSLFALNSRLFILWNADIPSFGSGGLAASFTWSEFCLGNLLDLLYDNSLAWSSSKVILVFAPLAASVFILSIELKRFNARWTPAANFVRIFVASLLGKPSAPIMESRLLFCIAAVLFLIPLKILSCSFNYLFALYILLIYVAAVSEFKTLSRSAFSSLRFLSDVSTDSTELSSSAALCNTNKFYLTILPRLSFIKSIYFWPSKVAFSYFTFFSSISGVTTKSSSTAFPLLKVTSSPYFFVALLYLFNNCTSLFSFMCSISNLYCLIFSIFYIKARFASYSAWSSSSSPEVSISKSNSVFTKGPFLEFILFLTVYLSSFFVPIWSWNTFKAFSR